MASVPAPRLRRPHPRRREEHPAAHAPACVPAHGRVRLRRARLGRRLPDGRSARPPADGALERAVHPAAPARRMRVPTPRQARRCLDVAADLLVLWTAARFVASRLDDAGRLRLSSRLARRTLATLGLDVTWSGEMPRTEEPMLVVANHVSWLDVYVLNAARP